MKAKRIRVTREEIDRSRARIITSKDTIKISPCKKETKWGQDKWNGLIYHDSYGKSWIADIKAPGGGYFLGTTDEVRQVIKHNKVNPEEPTEIIRTMKDYWSKKESQSCHLASGNNGMDRSVPAAKLHRATFRENQQLAEILQNLIERGYGIPTIQTELKSMGYPLPYRTLGRWVNKLRQNKLASSREVISGKLL